ncbi:MAG: hypothetical protein RSN88_06520, partial [Gordonibacter sp.]|uniref:hypothetical protein n=2 Tax=Gordonibacter sp. TaxID=1968902 RepID=UPI002FC7D010
LLFRPARKHGTKGGAAAVAMDLLDYLVLHTSAEYISDLRLHKKECAIALGFVDDVEGFSLEEWNHLGSYLSDEYETQPACGEARDALSALLLHSVTGEKSPRESLVTAAYPVAENS